jgi:uncharacterized membrane protein
MKWTAFKDNLQDESHRVARIVFILGAVIGLAMTIITPPFQVPDEDAHFFRAYQTSIFNLQLERRGGLLGADLPSAYSDTKLLFSPVINNNSCRVSAFMYTRALAIKSSGGASCGTFCAPIVPYPPAAYIVPAIAITVGKLTAAPPIVSLYLGRLLNLALFLFLTTSAIRLMPVMRWVLALLILMPMTMFEAASLSGDSFIIGFSFFMIAFLLHCAARDKRLEAGDIALMFAGATLLSLCKPGYSLLIFLALIIPWERFGTRLRKRVVIAGLSAVIVAIGIVCVFTIGEYSESFARSSSGGQLQFIFMHPLAYAYKIFRTLIRSYNVESFIGWLGWLDTRLSKWILIPYSLLLIAVPFAERRTFRLTSRQRLLIGVLFVLLVAALYTIQFLTCNTLPRKTIFGMQGRYFIPFAPLLFLLFHNNRFSYSIDDNPIARRILVGFIILVHLATAETLIMRYYPLA